MHLCVLVGTHHTALPERGANLHSLQYPRMSGTMRMKEAILAYGAGHRLQGRFLTELGNYTPPAPGYSKGQVGYGQTTPIRSSLGGDSCAMAVWVTDSPPGAGREKKKPQNWPKRSFWASFG